jgi:hypothetical protein
MRRDGEAVQKADLPRKKWEHNQHTIACCSEAFLPAI